VINKLKPKSEFTRNVLTLMTGTTIAQAIPIAISPILTRLYTPEDFGAFALFVSIVSILGIIASGSYEYAIMLPKKDEDAINIVALGIIITSIFSLIIFLVILFFHSQIVNLLNNKEISPWLYFIPLVVFLTGIYNVLNYWNNRKKYYKDLAKATVIKSIAGSITQLCLGFIKAGATGLISGQIISQMFANGKLLKNLLKNKNLLNKINKNNIIKLSKKYKHFFIFMTFSNLLNSSSYNILNILISSIFSINNLGGYFLAQKILGVPLQLISSSISQVFLKQSIEEKNKFNNSLNSFKLILKKMLFLLPFIAILYFYIGDLFIIVFGESWKEAAIYVKYMLIFFYIKSISSVLSNLLITFEKQKVELFINIIIILISFLSILILKKDFITFVKYYTFFLSIAYLLFIIYYYQLAKGN